MISVALFTDEPMAGLGLASMLALDSDFRVVGTWDSPGSLAYLTAEERPDVLLLDLQKGVTLPLIAGIRRQAPECRVVCWVRTIPTELAYGLLDLGIAGILPKTITGHLLVRMLRRIASGEQCVDETLIVPMPQPQIVKLTSREDQILSLVALGMKNRDMASTLSISEGTLKVYVSRLLQKTGLRDRRQLAILKLRHPDGFMSTTGGRAGRATPWPSTLRASASLA